MKRRKVIVIHQPDFLPYLGFFHRLLSCDVFVILDHVQVLRRGWHHRDRIKGPYGEHWLTIPLVRSGRETRICEARIDYSSNWPQKHLQTIGQFYRKAPFFHEIFPAIKRSFEKGHIFLLDLNLELLDFFLQFFDINVQTRKSSELGVKTKKLQLIVDLVEATRGTHYLSGIGAREYLSETPFKELGVSLVWQSYAPIRYPQRFGDFIENLSVLDFAMNCGSSLRTYLTPQL